MFNQPHHINATKHPSFNRRQDGVIVQNISSAICGKPAAERSVAFVFSDATLPAIRGNTFDAVIIVEDVPPEISMACANTVLSRGGFVHAL